jgi:Flp pilus assembly protein TadD
MEPPLILEMPDRHALSAALGWLGLGNATEALAELDRLDAEKQKHPDVLEIRWAIHAQQKNWDEALVIAQTLVEVAPENSSGWLHRAYSMRRSTGGSVAKAFEMLFPAFEKFPEEPTIAYNLACYTCQMQQLPEARIWLKQAMEIGGRESIRKMALADDDLAPLWPEIK